MLCGSSAEFRATKKAVPYHLLHTHYPTPVSLWLTVDFSLVSSHGRVIRVPRGKLRKRQHLYIPGKPVWRAHLLRVTQHIPIQLVLPTALPSPVALSPVSASLQLGTAHSVTHLSPRTSSFCHELPFYIVLSLFNRSELSEVPSCVSPSFYSNLSVPLPLASYSLTAAPA